MFEHPAIYWHPYISFVHLFSSIAQSETPSLRAFPREKRLLLLTHLTFKLKAANGPTHLNAEVGSGQHLTVSLQPTCALSQPHLISAPGLSAGDMSAAC